MNNAQLMDVRQIREYASKTVSDWTAVEVGSGDYRLQYGDVQLCTINERKPRVFRSLDGLKRAAKGDIGIESFRVQFLKD